MPKPKFRKPGFGKGFALTLFMRRAGKRRPVPEGKRLVPKGLKRIERKTPVELTRPSGEEIRRIIGRTRFIKPEAKPGMLARPGFGGKLPKQAVDNILRRFERMRGGAGGTVENIVRTRELINAARKLGKPGAIKPSPKPGEDYSDIAKRFKEALKEVKSEAVTKKVDEEEYQKKLERGLTELRSEQDLVWTRMKLRELDPRLAELFPNEFRENPNRLLNEVKNALGGRDISTVNFEDLVRDLQARLWIKKKPAG